MKKTFKMFSAVVLTSLFAACSKDSNPVIVVPPSDGNTLTLNGLTASEAGAAAGNSVFVDFSKDKQTAVARNSWDLGFHSGSDFKVVLNYMTGGSVLKLAKTDLNSVSASDFNAEALLIGGANGTFDLYDDPTKENILVTTAIATVSSEASENPVYILNRTANTVSAAADMYKIRILRDGNNYTLQYAKVSETSFKTLTITKDSKFNFQFVSLVNNKLTVVEPEKTEWDLNWGFGIYYTSFGASNVPYTFSDLVFINNLSGVTAAEMIFTGTNANTNVNYAAFTEANLSGVTFSKNRDVIGSKWRATTGTVGVKTDRFYLIKDAAGNVYKLKFVSFISNDGGERGKPVMEYKLIKKG